MVAETSVFFSVRLLSNAKRDVAIEDRKELFLSGEVEGGLCFVYALT